MLSTTLSVIIFFNYIVIASCCLFHWLECENAVPNACTPIANSTAIYLQIHTLTTFAPSFISKLISIYFYRIRFGAAAFFFSLLFFFPSSFPLSLKFVLVVLLPRCLQIIIIIVMISLGCLISNHYFFGSSCRVFLHACSGALMQSNFLIIWPANDPQSYRRAT